MSLIVCRNGDRVEKIVNDYGMPIEFLINDRKVTQAEAVERLRRESELVSETPKADPAALRAKALAATPGPWMVSANEDGIGILSNGDGWIGEANRSDLAYIAAIDPTTLLALLSERDALVAAERLEWMQAFGAISRAVAAGDGESDNTPWPDVVARIEGLGRAWVDALRQSVGEASRANTAEAERDALAARVAESDESSRFHQERARQAEAEVERLRKVLDVAAPHICPTCGPHARVDEDGCCTACGADTYFASDPYAAPTPPAPERNIHGEIITDEALRAAGQDWGEDPPAPEGPLSKLDAASALTTDGSSDYRVDTTDYCAEHDPREAGRREQE